MISVSGSLQKHRFARLAVIVALPFMVPAQTPISARAMNRVLEQGTWGPTTSGSILLERKGFDAWFNNQVAVSPSSFTDQALLNAAGNTNTNLAPVQVAFFQHALSGHDQLRQRVAFALSEIWVISELEISNATAFPPLMNIFQNRAFDNYEQLMYDVTLNPGMGHYLNMANNDKANANRGTSPNENYGRELMQLFTLGLQELNMDGSLVRDGSGNPIPTYSPTTVTNVTKALTGWTYGRATGTTTGHNPSYYLVPMVPVQANHDISAKALFPGYDLPANQSADQDLRGALHAIFMQPSLPPFVSKLLIQHLTTSSPSPQYIERIARIFVDNGSGVRGDLRGVIYAILSDSEARAGDDPGTIETATYGHMREPILFVMNLLRGLSGTVADNSTVSSYAGQLGQTLFLAPSVFSYFSPNARTADGLLAPEFQLYSTQTATLRANLVNAAVYGGRFDAGTTFNISAYTAAAANPSGLIALINTVFFHSAMSDSVRTAVTQAINPLAAASDKAKAALYVALTSSEYQIIH